MLRILYVAVIAICILPTVPGIVGVFASALSYIPPVGLHQVSTLGFQQVFEWQGVERSIALTLFSTLISSYLACVLAFLILQSSWQSRWWNKIESLLSPLLAMPHVAFAIGFAFLFSPTGLGMRLLDAAGVENQSGNQELPLLVKDPYALGLIVMLILKEIPFLLLMSIPILRQLNVEKILKVSASMGYSPNQTWWKAILPQWFKKMRFPMLAVLAYSVSVVDVALILGPTNPPTFAVLVWQWFGDPDLNLLPRAAAGAVVLFGLASILIGFARLVEWVICDRCNRWQYQGRFSIPFAGKSFFTAIVTLTVIMIPLMVIWSFAQRWRFPDLLPTKYSARFWEFEWQGVMTHLNQTLMLAVVSAAIALTLALVAHEYRVKHRWSVPGYIIAIPMLIPQLSILFGLQTMTLFINADAYWFWVCWAHVFFAFPYVYLSLDGPWRSFDMGLMKVAASLGKSPLRAWIKVKMPLLLPAIILAWAVGISVSLAQYLPTLMLGAGRVSTITTEAVALSSGFDRRVTAIYALVQAVLPLIFFSLAIAVGQLQAKYRRISLKGLLQNEPFTRKSRHSSSS